VFDRDIPSRGEAPSGGEGPESYVADVIARGQRLADSPWPWDGFPLEWHVEAWLIGDLSALAAVALLRSKDE
jgi:hypothetical protein